MDICIFMEQAHNLSSLIIQGNFHKYKSNQTTQNFYSILPHHVKHLRIPINDLLQIQIILERCKNLSTITFDIVNRELSEKVIKWFAVNTMNSTCRESDEIVFVWLGRKNIQLTGTRVQHKRIKLMDKKTKF